MNQFEQRVRELAYQIWESEGRPAGHEYRHWEMALKLAEVQKGIAGEKVTGNIPSVIAPEESAGPDAATSISLQPEQTNSSIRADISPRITMPPTFVSSVEAPSQLASTLSSAPAPDAAPQPAQARTRRKSAAKSLPQEDQAAPAADTSLTRSSKAKKNKM